MSKKHRRRCRWYEMHPAAKKYRERFAEKFRLALKLNRDHAMSFTVLPSGFFCWHFKNMHKEEMVHTIIPIAMAKANGSFEYDMLELEHLLLRHAKRVVDLRRR